MEQCKLKRATVKLCMRRELCAHCAVCCYHINYFTITMIIFTYLHYFKTGNSNLVKNKFIAEASRKQSLPVPAPLWASILHYQSVLSLSKRWSLPNTLCTLQINQYHRKIMLPNTLCTLQINQYHRKITEIMLD